jgi:hypothetical protein
MTADELHALLAEYHNPKVVIGELIYRRIQTVVKSLLSRRNPTIYARGLAGLDAVAEVSQDFAIDVLIEEGQLAYIFDVAVTIDDFDRLLYFQAGRYLARSRVRTVVDNLIDRAVRFLRNGDDIETLTIGKREVFVPKKPDAVQTAPDAERLLNRAVALAAAVPKLSSDSDQRAPAVYSAEALEQVLRIFIETYSEPIGRTELDAFFSKLLTAWKPSFLGLDSALEPEDRALLPEEEVMAREEEVEIMNLAASLAESMTREERDIFAFKHGNLPDRELAAHLNISRQSLSPRKHQLFGRLANELRGLSDHVQVAVLEHLAAVVAEKRSES